MIQNGHTFAILWMNVTSCVCRSIGSTAVKLIFSPKLPNVCYHSVSGMADDELISGRPYGGCAILWNNSITLKIEPISVLSKRLCVVKVSTSDTVFLLCTVYMPCDSHHKSQDFDMFDDILLEIANVSDN